MTGGSRSWGWSTESSDRTQAPVRGAVPAGLDRAKIRPAVLQPGYSRIIMNDTYLLAFITDPNFGRDLIAMMIMVGAECVLLGGAST